MSSATGKLIVIEGLEGAGKSTAVNTVVEYLNQLHIKTLTTREPGGTVIGETLRALIKNPDYKETLNDKSELLLLYAARIQLLEEVVKPALAEGVWVVADRFELSTRAYQGGGRGLDSQVINQLSAFALAGFKPDLTLYLDISPEQGMMRARSRGEFDRIEQQSIDFFHRVHAAYLSQIKEDSTVLRVDAGCSLPEVQATIRKALDGFVESKE